MTDQRKATDSGEYHRDLIPGPWYVKIAMAVFSKYGLATGIAVVFVGCSVYLGWEVLDVLRQASVRHFLFIDSTVEQSKMQTKALHEISESTDLQRQLLQSIESSNQRREKLQVDAIDQNKGIIQNLDRNFNEIRKLRKDEKP